ncbi:hypothetical protein EDB84DRAFT_1261390 [Lactarius hengduanensis]|nr:hypothetical protein EDB84DRAFT_1261390 [Lactarius hengduanensis]
MQSPEQGPPGSVQSKPHVLLIVFIHGFKGDDTTFGNFPSRLQHILSETLQGTVIETVVFPVYEVGLDGLFFPWNKAVDHFADWLTTLTVQKEAAHGGAGRVNIVLCGHSMGGLLAADSVYAFIHSRPDTDAPLWPNVVACIAFDTPYLGLHPHVFKNSATKAVEYVHGVQKTASGLFGAFSQPTAKSPAPATSVPSPGGWGRWGQAAFAVGGALVAGAAVGTAYYHRPNIESGYSALTEHMQYVGALWDKDALANRVRNLVEGETTHGILFRMFYILLPPTPPAHPQPRTFCTLPETSSRAFQHCVPAPNTLAEDEVRAHVSMFDPGKNDGYYQLGLEVAALIRRSIEDKDAALQSTVVGSDTDNLIDWNKGSSPRADVSTEETRDLLL